MDAKYLIIANTYTARVYINCNWNTTGGYYLSDFGVCELCQ